ncbi:MULTISPECIES: DUF4870 domain-containing protein [Deefgea]|uniref:DUF4870 domain-containing protein n=1 Tax=Deefgea chitinilytica TaxID=570276 RepID=A0ABS2CA12_9NEIS|nr:MULTISPECIES: DUF4870 domain-containing protein [Deefgea]MBM5570216.1 DUF4870 domain-containing protein [Deefgea chitinilytica]MBM9887445.1 DUF4870 domain-containing protein [Deefgea sp. CFH1-16]
MQHSDFKLTLPVSTDAKNWATLVYVFTLFFSFFPGLLAVLLKKEDQFVYLAGKEALNWSINILLLSCVLGWIPLLGSIVAGLLFITHIVCCILAAISTSKGLLYRFPVAFRLIV